MIENRSSSLSASKKNYMYNSLYQILLVIIPLITTPYISRILGAEGVGLFSYSHAIAYYFVTFIMLGLNNYGNRSIAFVRDDKIKLSRTFCEIYQMQVIISILIISIYIIYVWFFSNILTSWIMLLYVFSATLDISWLFFGLEQFKFTAIRSSIIKIISTLAIFLFVNTPDDIPIYALIYALAFFLSQIILWFRIKKHVVLQRPPLKASFKHLRPNLILFIPIIAVSLYRMMDKVMLGSLSNLEQTGFYESAEKIISVPTALIVSLGTIMMPKISNLATKKDDTVIQKYIEKSICFGVLMASSMCFGIMAVAGDFVPWFFGESYTACIPLFYILMPSCIFLAIADVVRTQYLIPQKQDKIYIESVIPGAIINLIINSILIPAYGATGAAIGTLVAEATVCILQILLSRKKLKIGTVILSAGWYILFGIIMLATVVCLPTISNTAILNLLYKAAVGATIFLLLALPVAIKQKIITKQQHQLIKPTFFK